MLLIINLIAAQSNQLQGGAQLQATKPIVFLFCVDLCMDEANLQAVKESIQLSTSVIPQSAIVSFTICHLM